MVVVLAYSMWGWWALGMVCIIGSMWWGTPFWFGGIALIGIGTGSVVLANFLDNRSHT